MPSTLHLLENVRQKPGLYLSRPSVRDLANVVKGYHIALHECGIAVDDKFSRDFQPWIEKKFNVKIARGWYAIIEFNTLSDVEAMKYFWELLDEFLDESGTREHGVATSESSTWFSGDQPENSGIMPRMKYWLAIHYPHHYPAIPWHIFLSSKPTKERTPLKNDPVFFCETFAKDLQNRLEGRRLSGTALLTGI